MFNVKIATKVELYGDGSFWDRKKVKKDAVPRLLNHEQGHFYIAHIAANLIEEEILKTVFTQNWQEEVRNKFHELNRKFNQMDVKYDQETMHSRNLKTQEKWDKWIKEQLQ